MRHATWVRVETSPFWYDLYRHYRRLPKVVRVPLRMLLTPRWHLAAFVVRTAARNRVVAGPFRGMRVKLSALSKRHLLGYILGSQERELHQVIGRVIDRRYSSIINVGAADGYYAIGLAQRLPAAQVVAFEALPEFHPVIERSARLNRVSERMTLQGKCDARTLSRCLAPTVGRHLVVMDIEGGEGELLDPCAVPALRYADILVETHDAFVPDITDTLIERFWHTHNIECYTALQRITADFPANFLPWFRRWFPDLAVDLMDERRTGIQRWLFLTAKDADANMTRVV